MTGLLSCGGCQRKGVCMVSKGKRYNYCRCTREWRVDISHGDKAKLEWNKQYICQEMVVTEERRCALSYVYLRNVAHVFLNFEQISLPP